MCSLDFFLHALKKLEKVQDKRIVRMFIFLVTLEFPLSRASKILGALKISQTQVFQCN